MSALLQLAERCEKATGPDRELDADICITAFGWCEIPSEEGNWRSLMGPNGRVNVTRDGSNGGFAGDKLPRLTGSLDAAMTLVPEGHVMAVTNCGTDSPRGPDWTKASAVVGKEEDHATEPVTAATPSLALCAAALKARAHSGEPA